MDHTTLSLITIPLFTGAIGYVTNWSGVWMLFYPMRFAGIRVPGLAPLANVMPRRIQQIPGTVDAHIQPKSHHVGNGTYDVGIGEI